MKNDVIHICFITDNNYAVPTAVAIYSIKKNKNRDTRYEICVLGDSLSEESLQILSDMGEDGFRVIVENGETSGSWTQEYDATTYVSRSAMIKFTLAERFPNADRVLYLDGDIIVQKDLSDLWNYDIENVYAGVVKNYRPYDVLDYQNSVLKTTHQAYFNSGVMLLNLKMIRRDLTTETFFDIKRGIKTINMDQDVLNVAFREKVRYLPLIYNLQSKCTNEMSMSELSEFYGVDKVVTKEELIKKASILHLASPYKPWLFSNVLYSILWEDYYKELFGKPCFGRKQMDVDTKVKVFRQIDISFRTKDIGMSEEIVVFIPAFSWSVDAVYCAIKKLSSQSVKPNRIIVLHGGDIQDETDLVFRSDLVEIVHCANREEYMRLLFENNRFSDCIKIVVAKDSVPDRYHIERLLQSYIRNPNAVSATSSCLMEMSSQGKLLTPDMWKKVVMSGVPSFALLALDNGSVLYPPGGLWNEHLDGFIISCYSYDAVLVTNAIRLICNMPVVHVSECLIEKIEYDITKLEHFQSLLEICCSVLGNDLLYTKLYLSSVNYSKRNAECQIGHEAEAELVRVKSTTSYKIGRRITKLPRKLKSVLSKNN